MTEFHATLNIALRAHDEQGAIDIMNAVKAIVESPRYNPYIVEAEVDSVEKA
jgi:hypothetical protein